MDDKIPPARFVDGPHGKLALLSRDDDGPTILWLGGYASDMRGTKAEAIDEWADDNGASYVRFDYSGHGESEGDFEDGTISRWAKDAAHILEHETEGEVVLVGSSMGGWIACLLLKEYARRIAGMVLINPAPDFATELTPTQWTDEQWQTVQREGRIEIPSEFDDSVMVYTRAMFDDGANNRVLADPLKAPCPVRILSGMADDVVPMSHVLRLAEHLDGGDVTVTLVKHGDHRLSTPADIERLMSAIEELVG